MKKFALIPLMLVIQLLSVYAQNRYVVFFTDKNNSPYSVSTPLAFLSQRAIDRRTNQGIAIIPHDFPVNPAYVSGLTTAGAMVMNTSRWFNSATITVSNPSVINTINALPYVQNSLNVGRIGIPTPEPVKKFDESFLRSASHVTAISQRTAAFNYGTSFNQVAMLKGDIMHLNGYTGNGMLIAVLDAGFPGVDVMPAFDSIRNSGRIIATWDFVDNNAMVYDDSNHGTMVLSTIGGNVPGEIIGTAPHASFLLLRSEDAPTEYIIEEYNWASAAEFADSAGADIINSSLGYTRFDDPNQDHSYNDLDGNTTPVSRAARMASRKGIVVCNSAGNEGNNSWFHISAPSDADSILGVGAVDASSVYVSFSGKGPAADGRVKPDVAAQGNQTIVADPWNGFGVMPANGTSFSSPLMAGMVATLWQCNPNATNMQLINAIRQSGNQAPNPDSLLGYGIPDFTIACMILAGLAPDHANEGEVLIVKGNPFGDDLTFSFYTLEPQTVNLKISDLAGKTVYQKSMFMSGLINNEIHLPTAYFSKGIYLLELTTKNKTFMEKIMRAER